MDMNRAFFLKKEDKKHNWVVIDAEGQPLGRLASDIADRIRGKHKVTYTPHVDCGDYIVVINADKVLLTGNKAETKEHYRYSGWIGGLKTDTAGDLLAKNPAKLFELAVKGMLPKNILSRQIIKKLKVYAGSEHPHKAQLAG